MKKLLLIALLIVGCEDACPLYYAPVCGPDGATYGNVCIAESKDITEWIEGECEYEYCDSDLVCGEALTCCDGFLYPTTCCANNCDENIGTCE